MSVLHATSTGQALSESRWLDDHFESCQPEYEAMLRSVGIQRGWRVLDAGCGAGAFLPLLTELVGPDGEITALDDAPENLASVRERAQSSGFRGRVISRLGSLTAIPCSDAVFDAVWCANALQYFGDDELFGVLEELRRVVRPGGIVAVKDVDMQLARIFPADPFLLSHLSDVSIREPWRNGHSVGSLRGRDLRRWLERAGLISVQQSTTIIERWAPFSPAERRLWTNWLAYLGRLAEERGVPDADLDAWQTIRDPGNTAHPLNDPEGYVCEGQVVAIGRVPGGDAAGSSEGPWP